MIFDSGHTGGMAEGGEEGKCRNRFLFLCLFRMFRPLNDVTLNSFFTGIGVSVVVVVVGRRTTVKNVVALMTP